MAGISTLFGDRCSFFLEVIQKPIHQIVSNGDPDVYKKVYATPPPLIYQKN